MKEIISKVEINVKGFNRALQVYNYIIEYYTDEILNLILRQIKENQYASVLVTAKSKRKANKIKREINKLVEKGFF